jgi:kynurenine formamidase
VTTTDFSKTSQATVRLSDIEGLEEFITDGAYLVFNTGWEGMWWGENPENGWYHPYNNGLNHPGLTPEVVDWLIALEERKDIRINGLVADNIAVESGDSLLGTDGSVDEQPAKINGPYLHALGLARLEVSRKRCQPGSIERFAPGQRHSPCWCFQNHWG